MDSFKYILLFLIFSVCSHVFAHPMLNSMDVTHTANQLQIILGMNELVAEPISFSTDHPARIILDFSGVGNALSKELSKKIVHIGAVKKVCVVESNGRMRVIIDLHHPVPYEVKRDKNHICLILQSGPISKLESKLDFKAPPVVGDLQKTHSIKDIGFHRGKKGEGRVFIDLMGAKMPIDLKEQGTQIVLRFVNTQLPERLERKLDVTDFGTPIQSVTTVIEGRDVLMSVKFNGPIEHMAYQTDHRFTLEIRSLTKEAKEKAQKDQGVYTGERLSLNFQDIEVRAVLQLIADFTGLNIVTSDTVVGNVTLRLRNVPWDQALEIILQSKGLDKRQIGNVVWIGPSEEMAAREKLELQNSQQVENLAPLRSEYIQINYAKASVIAILLKAEKNSLLSNRGSVSVDDRTNMLLIQDTPLKMDEIRKLVHHLDIPVKQVLIEARIVLANDDFEDALGVRFGGAAKIGEGPRTGIAGRVHDGSSPIALGAPPDSISTANRLAVNLPQFLTGGGDAMAQFGLTIAKLPGGTILDLELMALEKEGLGKIVSSPRLVTSDQHLAYIESGEEIPYNESTSSGAAAIAFKKAVLRLEVTPQITPDDHILLDLKVNQDSRGAPAGTSIAINTRELQTKVLVANGDTIVLGGIYEQTKNKVITRIPFLGRLPLIGWLFKSENNIDTRKEMMIFVTPRIIKEGMGC